MSNSPHPFSSILNGGFLNAVAKLARALLASPCPHAHTLLVLLETRVQVVDGFLEARRLDVVALVVHQEYLDAPGSHREALHGRGLRDRALTRDELDCPFDLRNISGLLWLRFAFPARRTGRADRKTYIWHDGRVLVDSECGVLGVVD
jgi:hypothetical protein